MARRHDHAFNVSHGDDLSTFKGNSAWELLTGPIGFVLTNGWPVVLAVALGMAAVYFVG